MFPTRPKLAIVLIFSVAAWCIGAWPCAAEPHASPGIPPTYDWGRGITWPNAHFNLGGYANVSYQHPETERQRDSLTLDEWSFFLTWSPWERLRFFSEVELDNWASTDRSFSLEDALRAERLYGDFLASDTTTLRVGKFLTPIGRWNVIHAAPLIWTTTRPVVTDGRLFSPHLNGIMLMQKFLFSAHTLEVSAYADSSAKLDVLDSDLGFVDAYGGRANLEGQGHWQIGASFINYRNEDPRETDRNSLFGLDARWQHHGYEVMLEAIFRQSNGRQGDEHGFYCQGIVPLPAEGWSAVARYEYLNGSHNVLPPTTIQIGVAGLTWRPYTPLAIKAEYRFGSQNEGIAPSGFFTSISTFF